MRKQAKDDIHLSTGRQRADPHDNGREPVLWGFQFVPTKNEIICNFTKKYIVVNVAL